MNLPNALKSGFSKYATFSGRACRSEYWYWVLTVYFLGSPIFHFLGLVDVRKTFGENLAHFPILIMFATNVFFDLFIVPVQVRRLHDINRSGWWVLWVLIPAYVAPFVLNSNIDTDLYSVMHGQQSPSALGIINGLVSIAAYITFFIWNCSKGTEGDNQYGPDPLA